MTWVLSGLLAGSIAAAAEPAPDSPAAALDSETSEMAVQAISAPLIELAGAWQLHGSPDQAEARRSAIDEAVAPLAWMVRVFAAPILHEKTAPPSEIEFFALDGQGWFQRAADAESERVQPVALGRGPFEHVDPAGDPFEADWDLDVDGAIKLRWRQSQATGQNRYQLDAKTGQLVVEQTIHVTEVKGIAPIVLISRFDRVAESGPPAVAAGGPGRPSASATP